MIQHAELSLAGRIDDDRNIDPMAETEVDQKQLAEQLLAQAKQGVELMGPNGLLNQLTKTS